MLFKTVCDEYHLIPEENYTVPPEAEGLSVKNESGPEAKSLLSKQDKESKVAGEEGEDKNYIIHWCYDTEAQANTKHRLFFHHYTRGRRR